MKEGKKGTLQLLHPQTVSPSLPPCPVGLRAATAQLWGQRVSVCGSPEAAISLSVFFPCPGAVASPPGPACPQPSETLPCSAQRNPFTPERGHGYNCSSHCPCRGSQHLCTPHQDLPDREGAWSRTRAAAQMIHPQSSVCRALQPRSSSQPSPASSGAPGVFPNSDGGWGHEKGCLGSITRAAGKHRELGEGGIWAGGCSTWCFWEQKTPHHRAGILPLFSVSNRSCTEQEQKQRRALSPSLPLAEPSAQPNSSPRSLAPLSPVQLEGPTDSP